MLLALICVTGAALCRAEPALPLVRFAGVLVQGSTRYSPEDLLPLYRAELGAPIDERFVRRLTSGLRERYLEDGYFAPEITAASLVTESGVVVVTLVEPRVVRVDVTGAESRDVPALWALIAELKDSRPLARNAFGAWLARANAIDGLSVTGTLATVRSGGADRIASLAVSTTRWTGAARLDNRVPEAVGSVVLQGQAGYRFASDLAGTVQTAAAVSENVDRLRFAALAGSHGLDRRGTTAAWNISRSESRLPNPTDGVDDYTRTRTSLSFDAPLESTVATRIDGVASLQRYDVDDEETNGIALSKERIRTIGLGLTLARVSANGRRQDADLSVTRGLDVLGARVGVDAPGAEPEFTRFNLGYRAAQPFGAAWRASVAFEAQASADRLPVAEQFHIGGSELGGAFDPASIGGDQGFGSRVEVARRLASFRFAQNPELYTYADQGVVHSRDGDTDHVASLGLGVRFSVERYATSLEIATPIDEPASDPYGARGTRVFFALARAFP